MKFHQYKDGGCIIEFSFKERWTLFRKGKLLLSPEALRHFSNTLMKIVIDFNKNFDKDTLKMFTTGEEKIKGE